MHADGFLQNILHPHLGVQARIQILKDELHVLAQGAQLAVGQMRDVAAIENNIARGRPGQAQDGAPHRGFAAAGFADQTHGFVLAQIEAHIVHRRDAVGAPVKR